jgi:hypothetical protein
MGYSSTYYPLYLEMIDYRSVNNIYNIGNYKLTKLLEAAVSIIGVQSSAWGARPSCHRFFILKIMLMSAVGQDRINWETKIQKIFVRPVLLVANWRLFGNGRTRPVAVI